MPRHDCVGTGANEDTNKYGATRCLKVGTRLAFVLCLPSPWELVVRATEVSSAMGIG